MSKFKALVLMQLKEKMDFSFLHRKKQAMFKIVFSIIGFVAITAIAYLIFWAGNYVGLFTSIGRIPLSVMALVLAVITALNIFTCTLGLSKDLFYAKDNQIFITLAVSSNQIYLSKMLVYYIREIKRTFSFVIPIFLAYGLLSSLPIIFYLWMPIMLIVYCAIPVLIGGLLAIPVNFIMLFFKKFPIIKIVILSLFLGGIIYLVVYLIGLIPQDIDLISSWVAVSKTIRGVLTWTTENLSIFYAVVTFLCGKTVLNGYGYSVDFFTNYSWIVLLSILGIVVVLSGINYLLSRPVYVKLVSRQFEYGKKTVKRKVQNKRTKAFRSSCKYESFRFLRDTKTLSTTLSTLIVAPIVVLLLNKIYAAINTRIMGDYLTTGFNILIILLFVVAHNISVASVFSKDGEALRFNKTKPQNGFLALFPRLSYNLLTTFVILLATCLCFFINSKLPAGDCVLIFLALLSAAYSHIIWCADIDFSNPQPNLFNTEGATANNPNEIKSTILTFAISLVVACLSVFFLLKSGSLVWLKMFIICFGFLAIRTLLFAKKVKTLYREM